MGVAAAKLERLLSCYKENFHADVSGREVWCLQMNSGEKVIISRIVLLYYDLYLNDSEGDHGLLLL